MRDELRDLHRRAGRPSVQSLQRHADRSGHHVGRSALAAALSTGTTGTPSWRTVAAVVDACLSYAHTNRASLLPGDTDLGQWRRLWESASPDPAARDSADRTVEAYLARIRERYGHLDIQSLLPLDNQQEQITIGVREVFVAQTVRSDPPPVDLPRELWQRLAESGVLEGRDLPDDLDRQALAQLRQSYEARPAKPVLEVLAEPDGQKLVILGDPGAGKSTLARYLAVALAQPAGGALPAGLDGLLPVVVELRDYAAGGNVRDGSFLGYLERRYKSDDRLGLPREVLEPRLREAGQVLVVFDGLDELFEAGDRTAVTHQITGFAAQYPGTRVLVTSRHVGYQRSAFDAAGFSHHMLQDLDRRQIAAFAERWYRISCPGDPAEAARIQDRLLTAIDNSRSVRELAGNPLLLTILAVIGRRQSLPRDRQHLYKHAVTVLVEHWEVSKHLAATDPSLPELDREDKLELLRLVARRMQDGKAGLAGNHIAGVDLLHMFEAYLREDHALPPGPAKVAARAMLEQFQHRNFILSRFGSQVYGFVHRTFLEYLAAEDIDIRFGDRELSEEDLIEGVFGRRWRDPAWHEVLLLLVGLRERFAGRIIDRLLAGDPYWRIRSKVLPQHLLLAIRCLAELRKPNALISQNVAIGRALTEMLEAMRGQARKTPLVAAVEQTVLPVIAGLGPRWPGREPYLIWFRLRGLTNFMYTFGEDLTVPATRIAVALDPSDTFCRSLFITAKARYRRPRARHAAIEAIAAGWPGHPDALPLLRECATTDDNWVVRQAAVRAIATGWRAHHDTLPWLRSHATTDAAGDVREAATQAISDGWPDHPDTLSLLHERVTDGNLEVRLTAIRAIVASSAADRPDTLTLLREYATDGNPEIRRAAIEAIAASSAADGPDTLTILRERVTDDHPYVSEAAMRAIADGWPDHPETLALLRDRVTDEDWEVRLTAVRAIAASSAADHPDTLTLLHERATDDHPNVAEAAMRAIADGWPDHPETVALLHRGVTDYNPEIRRAAILALAVSNAGHHDTFSLLVERATSDPVIEVRLTTVQAIAQGWPDHPDAFTSLRELATTGHPVVRAAALPAVVQGWRGRPDTLTLLHQRATDDDWFVRRIVIQAVASGWPNHPGTRPLLHDRANGDDHKEIRVTAMLTIAARWPDHPDTLPWLRQSAIANEDRGLRMTALELVGKGWPDRLDTLPFLRDRAVTDDDEDVREIALRVIAAGWPEHPGTLPLLYERAATDRYVHVRQTTIQAVVAGWPEHPGTLSWLHERATTDSHWRVRRTVLEAIADGWPAQPDTLPLLRDRAAEDTHEKVRELARKVIEGEPPGTA
jgi:HEAT repeat protein/energy-coupling factor transporter ATP-binding protein EcfA2